MDPTPVTMRDTGNNFFVTEADVGRPRAEVVRDHLVEMNDDVTGTVDARTVTEAASDTAFLASFSLVIGTQLTTAEQRALADACAVAGVSLILARSYGLVGHVRLAAPRHFVLEAKLDNSVPDLRIADPFPELAAVLDQTDLGSLTPHDRGHVPFVVLLGLRARRWREEHGGALPKTAAEKAAFKAELETEFRTAFPDARKRDEVLNYAEALASAYLGYARYELPEDAEEALAAAADVPLDAGTDRCWVLARAVSRFLAAEGGGRLPLPGALPDMHASTDAYMALQAAYRARADADVAALTAHVRALEAECGRAGAPIPEAEISAFARAAGSIAVVRTRTVAAELDAGTANTDELEGEAAMARMEQEEGDAAAERGDIDGAIQGEHKFTHMPLAWLLATRAADAAAEGLGRTPGRCAAAERAADEGAVAQAGAALLERLSLPAALLTREHAAEMVRYAGAEVHNVAALVGGVASQEAVKLLTHQYVPINNTFVFCGINGASATYEM